MRRRTQFYLRSPLALLRLQQDSAVRKSYAGEDLLWAAQEKAHTKRQSVRQLEEQERLSSVGTSGGSATLVSRVSPWLAELPFISQAKPPPTIQETMALVDQLE